MRLAPPRRGSDSAALPRSYGGSSECSFTVQRVGEGELAADVGVFEGVLRAPQRAGTTGVAAELRAQQNVLRKAVRTARRTGMCADTVSAKLAHRDPSPACPPQFGAVRSPQWERGIDLASFDGIELRVRGDGRAYSLNLGTDGVRGGWAHAGRCS